MSSPQSYIFRWAWSRVTARVDQYSSPQEMQAVMQRGVDRVILPRSVTMQKVDAGGVPAEWITPADAVDGVLLYIHGGAWTLGWNPLHRWLVGNLARATGLRALALDYRLAPQYPFPAALEDCLAAYRWLLAGGARPEKIVIGGDSAGGNLTLATLLALRDSGDALPAAGVCLSPVTDLAGEEDYPQISPPPTTRDEYEITQIGEEEREDPQMKSKPLVPDADAGLPVEWAQQQLRYYLGNTDPHLPLVSPFYADLRGLPPLLIQVGGAEYLRQDAERFAPRARAAGVDVTLQVWPEMWHVWQILVGLMPESNQAVQAIRTFVRGALDGNAAPAGSV